MKPYDTGADEREIAAALATNPAMRFLVSDRPHPKNGDAMATFGQFIGSWDLTMTVVGADGGRSELIAEWHFGWALHGGAVQDVLITRDPTGELVGYGTTVRTYDDRDGKWWIVWQDPIAHEFAVLYARPAQDTIELEGQWPASSATKFRWVFSSITTETFHWEALLSEDGGASWRVVEEMDARRRPSDGVKSAPTAAAM